MRKKTVTHVADTIFWYLLYFLPIIISIVSVFAYSGDWFGIWYEVDGDFANLPFLGTLHAILNAFGFNNDGLIYNTLFDIFGTDGLFGVVNLSSPILFYFQYFVTVYLIHLCVDFIIFIPRLAHKWLNKFTKECE